MKKSIFSVWALMLSCVCSLHATITCTYDHANASLPFVHSGGNAEMFGATTLWTMCTILDTNGQSITTNDFDALAKTATIEESSNTSGPMHGWFNGSHCLLNWCADGADIRFTNGVFCLRGSVYDHMASASKKLTYYNRTQRDVVHAEFHWRQQLERQHLFALHIHDGRRNDSGYAFRRPDFQHRYEGADGKAHV